MLTSVPKRYDAFLSYNSLDTLAVQELAERLQSEKLELYLEQWELAPGREFQPALAEGLRASKTCVVFLGPNGLGPWQKQEIQVAIDKRARDSAFPVIPVLLPGAERPRRGDVAHLEFLINASWVEFLKTLADGRAFHKLVWGITGQKPTEPESGRYEGICPYRGLETFRAEDAPFFFGREALTGWLISALRREIRSPQGVRFLGVLGPSGSGKSSVVLAGLVPKLKAGVIEGSAAWPTAILRPGDEPLKNLAAAVVSLFQPQGTLPDIEQAHKLMNSLRDDPEGQALDLFVCMAMHGRPADERLVLVVDQFEEVFTYRPQDDQARARFEKVRSAFFANLLNAAAAPGGRVAVVLTMRSDFLGACAPFTQLAAVLSAHQELVGPMTREELREAIERPAHLVGCEVEQALTERLLADIGGQLGALPLLQFALTEVWKKRDVRRLPLGAYEELGGLTGTLEQRANEIYRNLSAQDQDLCRNVFLRLVQPGEGTEDTKRRVSFRELLPENPGRATAVKQLVQALADRDTRLLTTEGDAETGGVVEVAHEALVRGWPQLRQWLHDEREGLRINRRLTEAAREWADAGPEHKDSYLYSGARLAVCREWARSHREGLNVVELTFLSVSEEAERSHVQKEQEAEQRARAKAAAERRTRRRLVGAAVVLLVLVGAVIFGMIRRGWEKNAQADRDAENALSRVESLLDKGWKQLDLLILQEAKDEADRAQLLAASAKVKTKAATFQEGAEQHQQKAKRAQARLHELIDRLFDGDADYWGAKGDEVLRDLIRQHPKNFALYYFRGWILGRQGKLKDSVSEYRKAILLDPDSAVAWNNLGFRLGQQGMYVEAEKVFEKTTKLKPDFADAWGNLGYARHQQKKLQEALKAYREVIRLKPNYGEAHYNLGRILMQQAQFTKAREELEKAKNMGYGDSWVQQAEQQCRRLESLERDLPAILEGTKKPAGVLNQLDIAQLCAFKKFYTVSARFFHEAFVADPKHAEPPLRYVAACNAALASQGKEVVPLDDKTRSRWRQQAFHWLDADFKLMGKTLNNAKADVKAIRRINITLQSWEFDPDLAGVRDRDALAKLPEKEREQWRTFWDNVANLRSKAILKELTTESQRTQREQKKAEHLLRSSTLIQIEPGPISVDERR